VSKSKRKIVESKASTIEISIAKCLSKAKLRLNELLSLEEITKAELIIEYGLTEQNMRLVADHVKLERQRLSFQAQHAYDAAAQGFLQSQGSYTRTSPLNESVLKRKIRRLVENHCGAAMIEMPMLNTPPSSGRMLDYGMQVSDSDEGRMFRQALHGIIEDSEELHELLTDRDDLPQWCHYKVAEAAAALSKIRDYLAYKVDNPEEPWHH